MTASLPSRGPPGDLGLRRHLAWLDQEIARLEAQVQQALARSPNFFREESRLQLPSP